MAILVGALVVLASQRGGAGGDGGPLNAIAQAAVKTQSEPGGRVTMRGLVLASGRTEPLSITGEMVYNGEGRTRAVLTIPQPDDGGSAQMKIIGDGTFMYMSSSLFGSLPDGSKWMGLDLALGEELDMPVPADGDVMGELELLEGETGEVHKVGTERVRGVPTKRYRGTLSVEEQADRIRDAGGEDLAAGIERQSSPVHFEVWIDADGLVRRMRIVHSQRQSEGSTSIDMRMDFFDFGIDPEIDVPESSEVFDATELAQEELDSSS